MSMSNLVRQVSREVQQVLRHQCYRSEDLRQDLGRSGTVQRLFGPTVNVMTFDYDLRFAGHPATVYNLSNGPVEDLSLSVYKHSDEGRWRIDLDVNPTLYTANDLVSHWQRLHRLLAAVIQDPDCPIGTIDLLVPQERHRILVEWNDTAYPLADTTLPELFEAQVTQSPNATAVVFQNTSLTYVQLNARANQLAHYLIKLGVGPENIVALALPRSLEMIVTLLGILKAGAAYLPIDPDYPTERLAFMLRDARPWHVLTTTAFTAQLPDDAPLLYLDNPGITVTLAEMSEVNPTAQDRLLMPYNPAYVIYTSGSTGTPKGVIVSHAGIPSLAASQIQHFLLSPEARVLQFASVSFDAAFGELCSTLLSGATLVLAPPERLLPGEALAILAIEQGLTHAVLPPTALAVMPADKLSGLSHLIVAGEACPLSLVSEWAGGRRMVNAYGPTEATVCATLSEPLTGARIPPLGRPIWNTQVYVLDSGLQPVPVGVAGELYIAGSSLACGYLGRPDLTAERFVADPFGPRGSRMYRSGDLARWRPEGVLDFLGRLDDQVKIRGFRIELGEIEAALSRHGSVTRAAVIVREDQPEHKQLVAYVVPRADTPVDPTALRQTVAEHLPDYMVPATVVLLGALPLTPNGKLDRRALPAPAFTPTCSRAPRTPQEEILAALFTEVLGLERVGIDDSFFELGGDSIRSIQLVSRVRQAGLVITPRDVFQHQTVAALALVA